MRTTYKIWWIIIILAALLRLWGIWSLEFKLDQFQAVQAAASGLNPWQFSHGMNSSTGLPNPPGFYQLLSAFRWLNLANPQYAAAFFVAISIITVALSLLFKKMLSHTELLIVTLINATSPLLIFMAGNIWAQMLLVPMSFLILFALTKAHQAQSPARATQFWVLAIAINIFASSIHMSGFFLLPVTLVLRPKNPLSKYDIYAFLQIVGISAILLGPYCHFLLTNPINHVHASNPEWFKRVFITIFQINGGGFGIHSFGKDYFSIAGEILSTPLAIIIIIALSCTSFITIIYAIIKYFKQRKSTNINPIITISTWMICGLMLLLLCSSIQLYYYYYLIIFAPMAVLIASVAAEFNLRYITIFAIASLALAFATRYSIASHGGHTSDYGIDYAIYSEWLNDLNTIEQTTPINLRIHVADRAAGQKLEPIVLKYLFSKYFKPAPKTINLIISSKNNFYFFNFSD